MALTKEQLDSLPESVRAQLKRAGNKERKWEKEILQILKSQKTDLSLDEFLAYLYLDHKLEVERVQLNASLNGMVDDEKIFKVRGRKAIFSLSNAAHIKAGDEVQGLAEESVKVVPAKPIQLAKKIAKR